MVDVGGVPGSHHLQVTTDASEAMSTMRSAAATVDTGVPLAMGTPSASATELPPPDGPIDYGLATSAVAAMSENVGVDFGRIAALMMMIDSELSRAARDTQVEQIEEIAGTMHQSADDLRASATMALVGGCLSGAVQIASATITIGGGVKGARLTTNSLGAEAEGPSVPVEETSSTGPTEETTAPVTSPRTEPGAGVEEPVSAQEGAEEARQENVQETSEQEASVNQKAAAEDQDLAASQQLSARAQNIALITQGMSQVTSSTGEIIKSALEYESRSKEAESKDHEAIAEKKRAYMERTKAFADSMQKGAQDMLQMYQQMKDSMYQTSSKVWSRA